MNLQLELVDGTLDQIDRGGVVERDVLVGDQFDNLLAGESTKEGGGRGRGEEAASDAAVSKTVPRTNLHFLDGLVKRLMNFFGIAVHCADRLGCDTLDLGDIRRWIALLLPRPPSEELVKLFTSKDGKNDADTHLRLGIRPKVFGYGLATHERWTY